MKTIKHKTAGESLTKLEFEDVELHEIDSGTTLPPTATEGDLYLKTDEHSLYIYIGG